MGTGHLKLVGFENTAVFVLILALVTVITADRGFTARRRSTITPYQPASSRPRDGTLGPGIKPHEPQPNAALQEESEVDSWKLLPVIYDDSHCQNGGTGYLGTFCLCLDYFIGRYCETDIRNLTLCGPLTDGEWSYRDCMLCRCNNGLLRCELFELKGCREKKETPNRGHHNQPQCWWMVSGLILTYYILKCNITGLFR